MHRAASWTRAVLPQGRGLTPELWQRRHRGMVRLLWLHVVVLGVLVLATGEGIVHALAEATVIAVPALLAGRPQLSQGARSTACALGLVISSAVAVHLSGGYIEVHFHYFVMVALLSLYQSWKPFLVAVGFVAAQHGIGGWLFPDSVYNHDAAAAQPFVWAAIHGAFLLAESVACLITWRLNEHQALHDGLTGLPNRVLLSDRLTQACRRRTSGGVVALLFVDLDNFKAVNDSAGHARGDELLVAVAERLRSVTRECDVIARLGGDEFALLLDRMEDDMAAVRMSTRILDALHDPFTLDGQSLYVTASVGVAVRYDQDTDAASLLRHADMAMYVAKRQGKASYEVFDSEVHAAVIAQLELEADLQLALQNDELVLHYQPILALDTHEIVGMEALVRWQHPRHGLLAPAEFIPIAEESGLIIPLGEWVLREACAQMAEWNSARATPLYLSVNLSPKQLRPQITDTVQAALDDSGLPGTALVLELTEAVLIGEAAGAIEPLHALRKLGVRIAIDDFGTGYSALNYLRRLPVDVVKIDRSFVQHLTAGTEDVAMVEAIVSLSRALGMHAIAEGVETASEASALTSLGVPAAQGYLFCRPAAAEDLRLILDPSAVHDTHVPAGG